MAFDFKKEYKEFYTPKNKPSICQFPGPEQPVLHGSYRLTHMKQETEDQ